MKAFVISIVILAVLSSSAFGSDSQLQEWLNTGSWAQGAEYCNRELVRDVSRRPDLRNVSAGYLSRLAVYCAALTSGQGDWPGSGWWWYTAASIDLETAQRLLPEMRKLGLLEKLPAPRKRGPERPRDVDWKKRVQLISGEIVPGIRAQALRRPEVPGYMSRSITGVAGASVAVEFVVPKDGVPQQPLLLDARALPVHVLFAYHYLSTWRFEPAKVDGEPVESLYSLTVGFRRD